jgi:hypothetical protein
MKEIDLTLNLDDRQLDTDTILIGQKKESLLIIKKKELEQKKQNSDASFLNLEKQILELITEVEIFKEKINQISEQIKEDISSATIYRVELPSDFYGILKIVMKNLTEQSSQQITSIIISDGDVKRFDAHPTVNEFNQCYFIKNSTSDGIKKVDKISDETILTPPKLTRAPVEIRADYLDNIVEQLIKRFPNLQFIQINLLNINSVILTKEIIDEVRLGKTDVKKLRLELEELIKKDRPSKNDTNTPSSSTSSSLDELQPLSQSLQEGYAR